MSFVLLKSFQNKNPSLCFFSSLKKKKIKYIYIYILFLKGEPEPFFRKNMHYKTFKIYIYIYKYIFYKTVLQNCFQINNNNNNKKLFSKNKNKKPFSGKLTFFCFVCFFFKKKNLFYTTVFRNIKPFSKLSFFKIKICFLKSVYQNCFS